MLKKCLSIIMVCFVFCATMIPTYAEENTGCTTCGIDENDEQVQKTLENLLDYSDNEKDLVMNSVQNSSFYAEHAKFIESSDRINIYKNDTADSYFTVSYIHKNDNGQVVGTLIFEVNREYEVEEVFGTELSEKTGNLVLNDYVKNTVQTYVTRSNVDCYTMRCARYEARATEHGWVGCEIAVGAACSVVLAWTSAIVSSLVCYAGSIAICSPAPAGMYCAQLTRVNVCPY